MPAGCSGLCAWKLALGVHYEGRVRRVGLWYTNAYLMWSMLTRHAERIPCTSFAYPSDGSLNSLGTSKSDLRAGSVGLARSTIDVSFLRSSSLEFQGSVIHALVLWRNSPP